MPPSSVEKKMNTSDEDLSGSGRQPRRSRSLYPPAVANPFEHKTQFGARDWILTILLGLVLVPVRTVCLVLLFLFIWPVATFATIGRHTRSIWPIPTWKRNLTIPPLKFLLQAVIFLMGFLVKVRGKRASWQEAPLLVAAPHTTFFDSIVCIVAGLPSVVSSRGSMKIPGIRKIILSTQPVLVNRGDPNSRQTTRKEILRRVKAGRKWPQILIFPEGVCTNGSCLVTFKLGAFTPGVPVQPVLIRFPNSLDTVTWTWQGFSSFQVIALTMSQLFTRMTIEFMPVYTPDREEREDPVLFANSVRINMANALGVPVTDDAYEDCKLMISAGELKLPMEAGLMQFTKISQKLMIDWNNIHRCLDEYAAIAAASKGGKVNIEEFATYLKFPVSKPLTQLFTLFDRNNDGSIDFREYVIGLAVLCHPDDTKKILQMSFQLFDTDQDGYITKEELTSILRAAFGVPNLDTSKLFREIAGPQAEYISYKTFMKFGLKHPIYAKLFSIYLDLQASQIYSFPDTVEV
ncbi:PREDICTED: lysophosphatidylcholine acyltransferase 2B-like [Elephantulus edwardii]|uniref:lysophosphatidylcholine acyltransferase 2B-like n=1 Tax=Elephantulus edwardii TaxID=28737 RepID=UPI0003F0A073|nr:PREDICTED: lysophosphatidylcholine acyltransferase 2B-like [Elephantulus edwardii]